MELLIILIYLIPMEYYVNTLYTYTAILPAPVSTRAVFRVCPAMQVRVSKTTPESHVTLGTMAPRQHGTMVVQ